jgi:quercetin dioxygenase-like cupin family protein
VTSTGDPDLPCVLAALYSLEALDDAEVWAYRDHLLAGCEACTDELEGFEGVVRALPYAVEPTDPSPILRDRLMDAVADDLAAYRVAVDEDAEWEPLALPGIAFRRLHVDVASRQALVVVRAEAGARYPEHRHASVEEMFMLAGELRFGDRVYRAGDYIRSEAGSMHASSETPGGCSFLLRASLDSELFG